MRTLFNPLEHPLIFETPTRKVSSTWTTHVPFGFYIINILRPKIIVELGTYAGMSYCAFCQAISSMNLESKCFAIDTWAGDAQSGFYGEDVLENLRQYHDPKYGHFSELIRETFDDALSRFHDGSVDLLHIDGCHTYEAVYTDFLSWLPKMSPRGVMLFHDITETSESYGVWRFWEEVREKYPYFEFHHGHGLGLLIVGSESESLFGNLTFASDSESMLIREFFHLIGMRSGIEDELLGLRSAYIQHSEAIIWLQEQVKEYEELRNNPFVKFVRSLKKRGLKGTARKLVNREVSTNLAN